MKIGAPLVDIATGKATDTGAIVGEVTEQGAHARRGPGDAEAGPGGAACGGRSGGAPPREAARRRSSRGSPGAAPAARSSRPTSKLRPQGAGEPLRGVRRAMAQRWRPGAAVVPATLTDGADISAWGKAANPTLRLIRAVVRGRRCRTGAQRLLRRRARAVLNSGVDLGIAVDTPEGLFVPVLKGGERRRSRRHWHSGSKR